MLLFFGTYNKHFTVIELFCYFIECLAILDLLFIQGKVVRVFEIEPKLILVCLFFRPFFFNTKCEPDGIF